VWGFAPELRCSQPNACLRLRMLNGVVAAASHEDHHILRSAMAVATVAMSMVSVWHCTLYLYVLFKVTGGKYAVLDESETET